MFGASKKLALWTVSALFASMIPIVSTAVDATSGTVSGTVFNDKNVNGAIDGGEPGVAGVSVSAYDSAGNRVGTATTDGNGAYSLSVGNATTSSVRVEFTTPQGYQPSFQGSGNGTSIQFVTIPQANVNYAVAIPGNYCADNSIDPLAVSTCLRPGPITGLATSQHTLTRARWGTKSGTTAMLTHAVTGSTWGIAQDPATGLVWNSAVLRRHSGLGPHGLGGIYVTTATGGSLLASFDIRTLQDQFGNPIRLSANDSLYTDAARGLDGTTPLSIDLSGYEGVGNVGIGDIDITPDGYLWISNLYEKTVLRIRLLGTPSTPQLGAVTEYTVPQLSSTTCSTAGSITANIAHPWALEYNNQVGKILVGIVCGRESNTVGYLSPMANGTGGDAGAVGGSAIVELDSAGSGTWTRVTSVDISRQRFIEGCNDTNNVGTDSCNIMNWKGWTNDFAALHALNTALGNSFPNTPRYPQPILSDIETLEDGSFAVGFIDRFSMQMGSDNIKPTETSVTLPWSGSLVTGNVAGDIQLLCKTGASTWVQEASTNAGATPSKGGCVGVTSVGGIVRESAARPFTGTFNVPGFGDILLVPLDRQPDNNGYLEFFNDTVCDASLTLNGTRTAAAACLNYFTQNHLEINQGGLAVWPPTGTQELASSAMDPNNTFNRGGVRWYSTTTGESSWGTIYNHLTGGSQNTTLSFMKSASMGDVEVVCDKAPVQIGNRVWIDANSNGIQDPGETPVAGVTVRLYASNGTTLRGTAITNANGEYYFSSNVTEAATGSGDHIGGGVATGAGYVIRVDKPEDFASGGPLFGYELTTATATSSSTDLDTFVDSNATVVASYPNITVPTVLAGINDHTFDVGFVLIGSTTTSTSTTTTVVNSPSPTVASTVAPSSVIKVSCGDYVWWDDNRDGIQDASESGIPNVVLTISNLDGSVVRDVDGNLVRPTKTDKNGKYSFDNLPPGQYRVTVVPPPNAIATIANSTQDSAVDSSTGYADSVNMNVDGQRDPTLDFGFYKPRTTEMVSVGNLVWQDRNGDGLQGPADRGIEGAILSIRHPDGSPVIDIFGKTVVNQKTKKDGKYLFTNLLPGKYVVSIRYPKRYVPTTPNRPNRGKNSSTKAASSVTLRGGERDLTLDFGVVRKRVAPSLPNTR